MCVWDILRITLGGSFRYWFVWLVGLQHANRNLMSSVAYICVKFLSLFLKRSTEVVRLRLLEGTAVISIWMRKWSVHPFESGVQVAF